MKNLLMILLAVMMLCGLSTESFSWGGHYGGHYGYRDGHYYRSAGWWGFGGLVTGLAIGAYVASLPPRYETVVVGGVPYYYSDGYYYQAGPNGYVVVAPPTTEGQAPPTENNAMFYILGFLVGILLLAGIGLLLKKLFMREGRPA